MYVISFRDLAVRMSGAVTPATVLELQGMGPAFTWWNPASLRDRIRGGGAKVVPPDTVEQKLANKRLCFIVHGYNVNRDRGYAGQGALAQEMLGLGPLFGAGGPVGKADLVIPVLWPGDGVLGPASYPFEMGDVRATGAQFAKFLTGTARFAASASFISHSLGARIVLETASGVVGATPRPHLDMAILAAAAADEDILDDPRYFKGIKMLNKIMVVSSIRDEILANAFPVGDKIEAALWRGEKASNRALGRFGPKALTAKSAARGKVRWFDIPMAEDYGHDGYLPTPWQAGGTNGWNPRREQVGGFLRSALTDDPFAPNWPPEKPVP